MVVLVTTDTVASKHTIALPHYARASEFCNFDGLTKDNIAETDPSKWPIRTLEFMKRVANEWKNAINGEAREEIFKKSGIWWSAFWMML